MVLALRRNVTGPARGTIPSFGRNIRLISWKETSVTREKIDTLLKLVDRLGLRTDDGDVAPKLQSTRSDALLQSVISDPI